LQQSRCRLGFVHVAIDDHSRIARADIYPDQKKESAVAFLVATVAYFRSLGITVERVMTDNGSCYLSKAFARACKQLGVKHIKIKPYAPQTNGKAERSFRPRLREWAYATAFEHSEQRRQALLPGSIATTSIGPMLASPKSHPAQHHSPDS